LTIESWNRYFQKQIHWRQVWLRIGSNKILKMKGRDLWYNIATNRLVLRSRLRKWQPESPSSCFACPEEETIQHLFYRCQHATKVWDWLRRTWKEISGHNINVTEEKVITGFPVGSRKSKSSHLSIILINLIMETLWSIWSERNRCSF